MSPLNEAVLSAKEARSNFSDLLHGEGAVVITFHERPCAILVPLHGFRYMGSSECVRTAVAEARRLFLDALVRATRESF